MDCPNCGATIHSEFAAWRCDVPECENWLCLDCDMEPDPREMRLCHEHQGVEDPELTYILS